MPSRFRLGWAAWSVLLLSVCFGPRPAVLAADYGIDVVIRTEEDLYHLAAAGTISEETLETLLDLLHAPIDLRLASRDELYALPGLTYAEVDAIVAQRRQRGARLDLAALAEDGVLTADQTRAIGPFVANGSTANENTEGGLPPGVLASLRGNVRLRSRYIVHDPLAPPLMARAQVAVGASFSAGAALVGTRLLPGDVAYDRSRAALVAAAPALRWRMAKAFATWAGERVTIIVGTFRLGFAERLTLDNSTRRTPSGGYPDDIVLAPQDAVSLCRYSTTGGAEPVCAANRITNRYVAADFRWREAFRGLAVSLAPVALGRGTELALHGFASYQARSIYQYDLAPRDGCPGSDCGSPAIFDAANPARRFAFLTLPHLFDELVVGGRIALRVRDRFEMGLTGYHARPFWRGGAARLEFARASPFPAGGAFGAVGIDGALHAGWVDLFLETARSLDHEQGGGGFGVLHRAVLSGPRRELELSARYYDRNFANPYARPISAPDELEGNRARNELGLRARLFVSGSAGFRLSSSADLWTAADQLSARGSPPPAHLDVALRLGFRPWRLLELASWGDYVNRDLRTNGRGLCYDVGADGGASSGAAPSAACSGELHRLSGRLGVSSRRRTVSVALQYGRAWVSDPRYPTTYRRDELLASHLGLKANELFRVDVRCRYSRRALDDEAQLESAFSSSIDLTTALSRRLVVRGRYELMAYLDHRATTDLRVPNPEHRVQLDVEGLF